MRNLLLRMVQMRLNNQLSILGFIVTVGLALVNTQSVMEDFQKFSTAATSTESPAALPNRSLMEKAHDLFLAMMYKSEIPGMPTKDYPIYSDIPNTQFRCADHSNVGYYADMETGCQVIHICQADGTQESFLCPNGTIFNQQYFVCDWWFNVDCREAPTFYDLNGGFGKVSEKNYYQEPSEKAAEKDYFQESRIIEIKH